MGKGLAKIIGFTSEAIHAAKNRDKGPTSASMSNYVSETPHSTTDVQREEVNFVAAEGVTNSDQREIHVPQGHAELEDTEIPRENSDLSTEDLPPYSPGTNQYNEVTEGDYQAGVDSHGAVTDTKCAHSRGTDADEAAWQLDEQTEELAPPGYEQHEQQPGTENDPRGRWIHPENDPDTIEKGDSKDEQVKKRERMIRALATMAGPPPTQLKRLPFPVIIPQRRPGSKKRGFVRAYAPVLEDCGLSQEFFLKFISDFHKASQASMWLQVVYVAANVTGFSPMLAVSATAASIAIVAGIALELQIGKRTNSFLDRANQEIFMPRGQYAMIMRFTDRPLKKAQKGENTGNAHFGDPEADRLGGLFSMEQINFNQSGERSEDGSSISQHQRPEFDAAATISKFTYSAEHPQMNSWQKRLKDYRKASGTTANDAHLPQCAPLVFPEIDRAAIRARDGLEPKSSFQSGATWVRDYIDRKEQESFETDHQGSALAVPKSERPAFKSRFNDPNHPASSGKLLSVLSGGHYHSKPGLLERAGTAIKESQDKKRAARGLSPSETFKQALNRKKKEANNRFNPLKEDVMYLMIVNMPTEDELRESVAQLQYLSRQNDLAGEETLGSSVDENTPAGGLRG